MIASTHLSPGNLAPTLSVNDQDGNPISLKDFRGQKVILFFYPHANTPTCTVEACNLRDHYQELKDAGFVLLGVSNDSERKQQNFKKKFDLPFPLLADKERKLTEAFGIWAEKTTFGRTYMGMLRTTFVIDEKGKVLHVISSVKAKNHAAQILELVSTNSDSA